MAMKVIQAWGATGAAFNNGMELTPAWRISECIDVPHPYTSRPIPGRPFSPAHIIQAGRLGIRPMKVCEFGLDGFIS
jgi:hypothetical protein